MEFQKQVGQPIATGALLAEGPVWDEQKGLLYWVDILKNSMSAYDPASKQIETLTLPDYPSTLALEPSGSLLVTAKRAVYRVEFEYKTVTPLCHFPEEAVATRFNDGKPDPQGRLWVGTMALDQANPNKQGAGSLYCIRDADHAEAVLTDVTISNGLCWWGTTFYYIDTPTQTVCAFDYDEQGGTLSNGRVCVRIDAQEGSPDGMTIDREGMLWVAQWGGGQVGCYNPKTGGKRGEIRVPDRYVSCCTFGGEKQNILYITTAKEDDPNGGNLYEIPLGSVGFPADRCMAFEKGVAK